MENLDQLRNALPDTARDIKLNLQSVLQPGTLSAEQTWGTAVATAMATRHPDLVEAVLADARAHAGEAAIQDAQAAATLMGMNNVYYRFRHMIGKETYSQKPARLRMGWNASEFRCCRLELMYPPLGSTILLRFKLPEAPAARTPAT